MVWRADDPRWLRLDKGLIALMSALFVASVLAWRGVPVFGDDPSFRPLASVYLTGALLLQAVGGLLSRKRLYPYSLTLMALSIVGLWFSVTVRR